MKNRFNGWRTGRPGLYRLTLTREDGSRRVVFVGSHDEVNEQVRAARLAGVTGRLTRSYVR